MPWAVYGTSSGFHLFMNPKKVAGVTPATFDPFKHSFDEMKDQPKELVGRMRLAMLVNGVDLNPRLGGFTSVTHKDSDVADTVAAFREAIRMLRAENELPA